MSAALLLTAAAGWWINDGPSSQTSVLLSICQRIGLVLGACWLAYPQLIVILTRTSLGLVLLMSSVGLILLVRPRTAIVLVPALLVLAALQFIGWLIKPPRRRARRGARDDAPLGGGPPV